MSDDHTLHYEGYQRLTLDGVALRIGERIEIDFEGEWRAGVIEWDRNWQAFYIQLDNHKGLWMWERLPARRLPPNPDAVS